MGLPVNLYYWRDKTGHEIDVITDNASKIMPIETKSGKTFQPDFLKSIYYWKKLSHVKSSVLLYGGAQKQQRSDSTLITNWREVAKLEI